ncbi:MAG: FlgD immunoglobulin-like domain containing protein, partial [Candidatus Eisenbacteria bacterium]
VLLGDPAVQLSVPRMEVVFDTSGVDTVRLGEVVTTSGEILEGGNPATWVNGDVDVVVAGSQISRNPGTQYYLPGYTMFHGRASVERGRFDFSFVVPVDTVVAGPRGRTRGYSLVAPDGAGVQFPFVISREAVPPVDTTGPLIVLRFDNDARYVAARSVLRITLSDEHGINTTGTNSSNSILLQIDRALQPVNLTSSFAYLQDSYQQGSIDYLLPELVVGPHTVTLIAHDNVGNGNSRELTFEVVEEGVLSLRDVFNYPNPFKDETYIAFELTMDALIDIKIFTVSGEPVVELYAGEQGRIGQNHFGWDGRDSDGHAVANGVYIYKIEATDGQGRKETFVGRAARLR